MRTTHGFTLLELMITVAIIGILAAIAIPNYNTYVLRGNRTVAKTILAEVASRQENFFTDRKTYATTLSALGYPADTFYFGKSGNPSSSSTGALYAITLPAAAATSFTVIATAQPGSAQANDTQCASLSLTNTGVKSATGGGGSDCWTR